VVGVGPGSFTGIRVALATALGLRRACGVPVVTVSTFECLVAAHADPRGALVVTVPTLPGEVYAERWNDGAPEGEAWLCLEAELPAEYTRVFGVTSLEAMLDASRGKSPVDELLPRYVAPPKITLPKQRTL
jgi:tRNA A37 threonylcarbamoyladenosine modification protein TsaB